MPQVATTKLKVVTFGIKVSVNAIRSLTLMLFENVSHDKFGMHDKNEDSKSYGSKLTAKFKTLLPQTDYQKP